MLHVLGTHLRRNVKNTKTSMGVFVAKGWGGGEGGGGRGGGGGETC